MARHLEARDIIRRVDLAGEEPRDNTRDQRFEARRRRAHDPEVDLDALPRPEVEAFPGGVGGFVGYYRVVEAEGARDTDSFCSVNVVYLRGGVGVEVKDQIASYFWR